MLVDENYLTDLVVGARQCAALKQGGEALLRGKVLVIAAAGPAHATSV